MLTFAFVTAAPGRNGVFAICKLAVTPSFSLCCGIWAYVISSFLFHVHWIYSFKSLLKTYFSCASVCLGSPDCFSLSLVCVSISFSFNFAHARSPPCSQQPSGIGFDVPILQMAKLRFSGFHKLGLQMPYMPSGFCVDSENTIYCI